MRGNASEGIHAASTGGVWQAVVFGFAGVRLTQTGPKVENPRLPSSWTRLQFKLKVRDHLYNFDLARTQNGIEVKVINSETEYGTGSTERETAVAS